MACEGPTTLDVTTLGVTSKRLVGWCATIVVATAAGAGCGPDGPQRYHVSGTVTYGGQPVPAGAVSFIPIGEHDRERGPGFCRFTDGRYESRQGRSPGSGPYRVIITGYDGVPFETRLGDEIQEHPMGKPIFDTQVVEIDLPAKHGGVFNFDLPSQPTSRPSATRASGP
jgi:hypothetical protein